jgi:anti-anti-sigma regulatory factor
MARILNLTGECVVNNAGETAQLLLGAIQSNVEVTVDLGKVERIDTAGVQLLLAARKEADDLGVSLSYKNIAHIQEFMSLIGATL